jgi:uncharacterized protein YcfJ
MNDISLPFRNRAARSLFVLLTLPLWLASRHALGQESASQQPSASSPSKSIGLFAYAKKGQSADQQAKDETECFASAKEKTGVDPQATAPAGKTAEQKAAEQKAAAENTPKAKGGRARGAARGAAGGAAIGAIADDEAGKGAGAGAVAGSMKGGRAQRKANAANKEQRAQQRAQGHEHEQSQLKPQHQQNIDIFNVLTRRAWKHGSIR